MSFLDLARRRRSVRKYENRPVPAEALEHCLEASRLAPSGCNSQPWTFIVVDDPEARAQTAAACVAPGGLINSFVHEAPVIVAVVAEPASLGEKVGGWLKEKDFRLFDLGIAAAHFCLAAAAEGLGTCMIGWFDEPAIARLLEMPQSRRVALLITVGYAADQPREKQRKSLAEITRHNRCHAALLPRGEE